MKSPDLPTDLPVHLAERPTPRGLGRIGVGTAPFNILATVLLVAMSSFVVIGASYVSDAGPVDQADALEVQTGSADERTEDLATMPLGSASADTTPTSTSRSSSSPVRQVASATPAAGSPERASPMPSTTTPVPLLTCDLFATQAQAQKAYDADPVGGVVLDGDGDALACEHLPWARPEPEPTVVLPTTEALLRPSTRLYGVHTAEAGYAMHEVSAFAEDVGKSPNNVMFFTNLSKPYPQGAVDNAWSAGMLPIITFEPIVEDSDSGQPLLRDITNGDWDAYFQGWAAAAAADGRPVAFRFAQEMNGNWYSWSDGRFGNAAGDYVAAWRHVHDLFSESGADNVLFLWSVNRIDNLPDKTLDRVYPGDDYVDWVGMSGYYRDNSSAPTFDTTFEATLAALKEVAPSKVILLTEVGAGTGEAQRVQWIESFFDGLLAHQEIIGFTWFNDFKSGGDWSVQFSDATIKAFTDGVADARYGSLVREAGG